MLTTRFSRQIDKISEKSKDSPVRRSPGRRSFHSRGPAAKKLISSNLLCVRRTSSFRVSLESGASILLSMWRQFPLLYSLPLSSFSPSILSPSYTFSLPSPFPFCLFLLLPPSPESPPFPCPPLGSG